MPAQPIFPGSGKGVVNKFTDDNVIAAQENHNVRRLNQVPDNEDLAEFLADDTNLREMQAVLAARHPADIKAALRMCGFWPSAKGSVPAGPGIWADPAPPPRPPQPLIF